MNGKNEVFKKLLPIKELFELYQRLSKTIVTKIDINNLDFDFIAVNNSINLLYEVRMIEFNQDKNIFERTAKENCNFNDFKEILYSKLKLSYPDTFLFFSQTDLKYDEVEAKIYLKRNSVNLELSGLLMLLDGIGKIEIRRNDIFILDKSLLACRANQDIHQSSHKTLSELKNQLDKNEEFGMEAELAAMEYEVEILKNARIYKSPERISEYNINAGYDIVSFMHVNSLIPDKFIEVKSCADERWIFYISKNELDVAKRKQNSYYLYLFNRKNHKFRVMRNPYNFFFESEDKNKWAFESQIYQVKSLEKNHIE